MPARYCDTLVVSGAVVEMRASSVFGIVKRDFFFKFEFNGFFEDFSDEWNNYFERRAILVGGKLLIFLIFLNNEYLIF